MTMTTRLYRSYLGQVRALPHVYLRRFFKIKGADDLRSVLKTESESLRKKKLKRVFKDLRRLRAANAGQSTAFDRILDIAYGRVGKLRRELIQPLLSDSNPPEKRTCSPAYSPELASLLTSGISRTTKALQKHHLASPPGLPARAKPDTEDAVLLGPLSRRRERNIHWRFFKNECNKVYPPLQISLQRSASHTDTYIPSNTSSIQNDATLLELLALAGSYPPDRQNAPQQTQKMLDINPFDGHLPVRWLRRRYQALLGRVPLLVPRLSPQDNNFKRTYDVQLADNAISSPRLHPSRLRIVAAEDILWMDDIHHAVHAGAGRRRT